jgi:hypothetical protein
MPEITKQASLQIVEVEGKLTVTFVSSGIKMDYIIRALEKVTDIIIPMHEDSTSVSISYSRELEQKKSIARDDDKPEPFEDLCAAERL